MLRSCGVLGWPAVPVISDSRCVRNTIAILGYLPTSINACAGGGTKRKETRSQRTKGEVHITNKIYDGYDTKRVDIRTQNTKKKKALRKREQKKGSCGDRRWVRGVLGAIPRRGLARTVGHAIHRRCIRSGSTPILIPRRVVPSTITVPCGVVIHRRLRGFGNILGIRQLRLCRGWCGWCLGCHR